MKARTWLPLSMIAILAHCSPAMPSPVPLGGTDEGEPDAGDAAAPKSTDAGVAPQPPPKPSPPPVVDAGVDAPDKTPPDKNPDVDAGADAGPTAASPATPVACDNSVGNPGSCAGFGEAQQCGAGRGLKVMCGALVKVLQPRPAEKLVACLHAMDAAGKLCDEDRARQCFLQMVGHACVEKDSAGYCEKIERSCTDRSKLTDDFTPANCRGGLSAAKPEYRKDLAECIRTRCDVSDCAIETLVKAVGPSFFGGAG